MTAELSAIRDTMFIKIITGALLSLIGQLIDRDVLNVIKSLVLNYMNFDNVPGEKKRQLVREDLVKLQNEFQANLEEISNSYINTAIEISHSYFKARKRWCQSI